MTGLLLSSACLYSQGSSDDPRLLHAGLAAGLLPDEAEEADSHLHLQPTQRVPGGPTIPSHRRRHQAQGDAAHLPELAPVHADRDRAACSQPEVTRRRIMQHRGCRVGSARSEAEITAFCNNCCVMDVSLPSEAQVQTSNGRKKTGVHVWFWRNLNGTLRSKQEEKEDRPSQNFTSELLINCWSAERTRDVLLFFFFFLIDRTIFLSHVVKKLHIKHLVFSSDFGLHSAPSARNMCIVTRWRHSTFSSKKHTTHVNVPWCKLLIYFILFAFYLHFKTQNQKYSFLFFLFLLVNRLLFSC